MFLPASGPFGLPDYEKIYAAISEDDIFGQRGISRDGAIVVVRPRPAMLARAPSPHGKNLPSSFGQFYYHKSRLRATSRTSHGSNFLDALGS